MAFELKTLIDDTGTTVYYGYARPGTDTNVAEWKIARESVSGNVTLIEYAGGSDSFSNKWDDRATYQYS